MFCSLQHFTIFGYARTAMTDHELWNLISKNLTCRVAERSFSAPFSIYKVFRLILLQFLIILSNCSDKCDDKISEFLKCCFYHSDQYSSEEHFMELNKKLEEKEVLSLYLEILVSSILPLDFNAILDQMYGKALIETLNGSWYDWITLIRNKNWLWTHAALGL